MLSTCRHYLLFFASLLLAITATPIYDYLRHAGFVAAAFIADFFAFMFSLIFSFADAAIFAFSPLFITVTDFRLFRHCRFSITPFYYADIAFILFRCRHAADADSPFSLMMPLFSDFAILSISRH
jgi:hypothetical protein